MPCLWLINSICNDSYIRLRQIVPIELRMLIVQISFGSCATNGNSITTIRFSNCQLGKSRCDWRYSIRLSPIEERITRFKLELIFSNANYRMIKLKYNLGNESFVHNIITRQEGTARFVYKLNRQFPAQTS